MLPDDQLVTLTRRFQQQLAAIGQRYAGVTTASFRSLGTYEDGDIERFVTRIRPSTIAARRVSVAAAVAYFALLTEVRPPSIAFDEVDVPDETREPFIAMRTALGNSVPFDLAVVAGTARAAAIARNLAVSSGRRTGDLVMERTGQRHTVWVRMPDSGACDWCREQARLEFPSSTAADYGHDRCGCQPRPRS